MSESSLGLTDRVREFSRRGERLIPSLAVLLAVALALEHGFYDPPVRLLFVRVAQVFIVVFYLVIRFCGLFASPERFRKLIEFWPDVLVVFASGVFLICRAQADGVGELDRSGFAAGVFEVASVVRLAIGAVRLNLALSASKVHPARLLALTFGGLIVLGTFLLSLPRCTTIELQSDPGFSLASHILNCSFTTVSATCVTGLTVYDTGSDFTIAGQVVILLLMQLGGLGIMVFGSLFGLLVHRQLSLRQSLVLQDSMSQQTFGQMRRMLLLLVVLTFSLETIGAICLLPMWEGISSGWLRVFYSVFHSVSAFCNAGFSLQPDSLTSYSGAWQVYVCIMPLIVFGGLGFPVLDDLWKWCIAQYRRRMMAKPTRKSRRDGSVRRHGLSLHTRIVLVTSCVLVVVPTILFIIFELCAAANPSGTASADRGVFQGVLDSLFLAITCRTAGFNTFDLGGDGLSPASHLLACVLMFVGGSPASTAGGIKTVTAVVVAAGVWSTVRGRKNVEVFNRTIPRIVVGRAVAVVAVMLAAMTVLTIALALTQAASLHDVLFESVSAFGTVGLSTGLTSELTPAGRLIIMIAMFIGRLGPLTLLIAFTGERSPVRFSYPEEQVGIG